MTPYASEHEGMVGEQASWPLRDRELDGVGSKSGWWGCPMKTTLVKASRQASPSGGRHTLEVDAAIWRFVTQLRDGHYSLSLLSHSNCLSVGAPNLRCLEDVQNFWIGEKRRVSVGWVQDKEACSYGWLQ